MERKAFCERLAMLRSQKNVSARDMSLSLGQSTGYISNIENGVNFPSMQMFFYICEYLNITPAEFFDTSSQNPEYLNELMADLKHLDAAQLEIVGSVVKGLMKK